MSGSCNSRAQRKEPLFDSTGVPHGMVDPGCDVVGYSGRLAAG